MSVVIARNPAFWAPGHLILPDQPGKPLIFKFKLRFKRLKTSEQQALDERIRTNRERMQAQLQALSEGKTPVAFEPAITDKELLDMVLVDWEGFQDESGGIAIYTEAARAQVVEDVPGIEAAMAKAYLETRTPSQDLKEAEKNSEAPHATT